MHHTTALTTSSDGILEGGAATAGCEEDVVGRQVVLVLMVAGMIALVVGVDLLFFRHEFWPRLMANVGIVLLFGAFYLRFLAPR
jgi:predicted cobalt transporter CbtA